MLINSSNLDLVFKGFKTVYSDAFAGVKTWRDQIAMTVPSAGSEETYGWIGRFPNMREWVGPRVVHSLSAYGFTIQNRKFESTISVPRTSIADDKFGVFKPMFSEMGRLAGSHPEELLFGLLKAGFDTEGFDGQFFFDTDHPLVVNDAQTTVSNVQAGSGTPWFLLDASREVRPLIWQEREPYTFVRKDRPEDDNVFNQDEFIYGVNARANAGFGLWQLAFGSKADLTPANYAAARAAMMGFRADGGRLLGVSPTHLVVPPSYEEAGRQLLNSALVNGGESNPWAGSAELIVTPWLAD